MIPASGWNSTRRPSNDTGSSEYLARCSGYVDEYGSGGRWTGPTIFRFPYTTRRMSRPPRSPTVDSIVRTESEARRNGVICAMDGSSRSLHRTARRGTGRPGRTRRRRGRLPSRTPRSVGPSATHRLEPDARSVGLGEGRGRRWGDVPGDQQRAIVSIRPSKRRGLRVKGSAVVVSPYLRSTNEVRHH